MERKRLWQVVAGLWKLPLGPGVGVGERLLQSTPLFLGPVKGPTVPIEMPCSYVLRAELCLLKTKGLKSNIPAPNTVTDCLGRETLRRSRRPTEVTGVCPDPS